MDNGLSDEAQDGRRVVEGRVKHDQLLRTVLEFFEADDGQGVACCGGGSA